ncbi:NADP-dependent oxidoreductase [Paraburkholderia sp. UCT2]|uniref:NADP-dependent oxidoreductase n=1 Tax=Paraburkholderia sp. UCT2 TaxID=2615208 RepID=UPI001654E3B7|nr:NADP-dependent oxidoreductase [Paraburkholderia sp. UCT2]MBC8731180.1 NADP-dependent oxidoreductase [Paraburkholderia sp. UCT2]
MSTMLAYRIHRFGGPEVFKAEKIEIPELGAGQVLVRVRAASANPVDLKTRSGQYPLIREEKLPYTLGRDFSGVVERVGEGVGQWRAGERVYGFVGQGQGAYAEFVVVSASALARAPEKLDVGSAGAVPLAALTAWQGLFDHGCLEAGGRVLIHAGAGGVGHFAVQFAKQKGAQVYATASGDGIEFVRSLGADRVIDYHAQRFEDVARDIDLVFDLIGGDTQRRSWSAVATGGALVSTLNEPSQAEASSHGARATRYTARPDGRQLTEIASLLDKGSVRVVVAERFAFDATAKALERLAKGHVRGKIVVEVAS